MYNTSNPAELYARTTWELLPNNKFLKTGSTPLQQTGSNSIKIAKANLPADKLQVESHSMTRGNMEISGYFRTGTRKYDEVSDNTGGAFRLTRTGSQQHVFQGGPNGYSYMDFDFYASRNWTGSTSSASPYTTAMGSGTPLTINPEHITIRAWKRLS